MNFISAKSTLKNPQVIITGIPLQGTSSFLEGASFSPQKIRQASINIETFSFHLKKDLQDIKIKDAGDLCLSHNLENDLRLISDYVKKLSSESKALLIFLGGEHTITIPILKGLVDKYRKINLIYFDAHLDLRDSFNKNKLSHACTLRRILEIPQIHRIFHVGARSASKEEFLFKSTKLEILPPSINSIQKVKKYIGNIPCYISFDFDFVDSSQLRSVTCPQAGGPSLREVFKIIHALRKIKVIGIDFVEYNGFIDTYLQDASFCCEIIREFILSLQ